MKVKKRRNTMVESLAKEAGVSTDQAAAVLKVLGVKNLLSNINAAGMDIKEVNLGDLKLATRIGRSGLIV